MTQMPQQQPAPVIRKPQPNIYTVLLIVAIIALAVTIGLVIYNLMADPPNGYGLEFGQLFKLIDKPLPEPSP